MSFSVSLRDFQSQSPQQWLDRTTRTLPQALCVVLVIAIAWQLVQLTWMLFEPAPNTESGPIEPSSELPVRRKAVDVEAIVNAKLFGSPQSVEPTTGPA